MRILFIGDIVGQPGRMAVETLLANLRREHNLDVVVANGENVAGGFGITRETAQELLRTGVDVITTGGHVWDQREIIPFLNDEELSIIRPLNYPPGVPGRGYLSLSDNVVVVNLIGRVFIGAFEDPFRTMDTFLKQFPADGPKVILVDFHAEATSEKGALAWYLDGRVSVVVGTHTHVATCDHRILPKGTAFVSDVGMVGPQNSVIGNTPSDVLTRFLTQMPRRLTVPKDGPVRFNSVLVEVDSATGRASHMERIDVTVEL